MAYAKDSRLYFEGEGHLYQYFNFKLEKEAIAESPIAFFPDLGYFHFSNGLLRTFNTKEITSYPTKMYRYTYLLHFSEGTEISLLHDKKIFINDQKYGVKYIPEEDAGIFYFL